MIKSAEKLFKILEYLGYTEYGPRLVDISRKFQIKTPTAHNLLMTLVELGYVDKTGDRYNLTQKIFTLFMPAFTSKILWEIAEPRMKSLSEKLNESVLLAINKNGKRHTVGSILSDHRIIVNPGESSKTSLYDFATGRILLAFLNIEGIKDYVEEHGYPGTSWNNINSFKKMQEEVQFLRNEKLCTHVSLDGQIQTFAVPIFGQGNNLVAALGVYLPKMRCTKLIEKNIIKAMKYEAFEISSDI